MRLLFSAALMLLSLGSLPVGNRAAPQYSWEWLYPVPQGNLLSSIACGNGRFVASGHVGTILVSDDGVKWTVVNTSATRNLNSVVFPNNSFVTVGDGGTILTSSNGTSWTKQAGPSGKNLYDVTFGNGFFVAVGGDNGGSSELATSPDGVTWTHLNVPSSNGLNGIAYGNKLFVAVGRNTPFLISSDGKSWTRADWSADLQGPFYGIAFGKGTFAAAGAAGAVATSSDGHHWSMQNLDSVDFNAVALGDAGFTLVGRSGAVWQSSDGTAWSHEDPATSFSLFGVAACGSTRVAVGNAGAILVDTGSGWTNRGATIPGYNEGVAAGNNATVVVGFKTAADGSIVGLTLTSHDGKTFIERDGGTAALYGVAFAAGKFVAVGDSGTVRVSEDGDAWTTAAVDPQNTLHGVTYGKGLFVAVGEGPMAGFTRPAAVFTSPDGLNWTDQGNPDMNFLYAVTYGNGLFVAGGTGGILTSTDGGTWTKRPGTAANQVLGLAYGDGTFVAVGSDSLFIAAKILMSTNGITWINRNAGVNTPLKGWRLAMGISWRWAVMSAIRKGF